MDSGIGRFVTSWRTAARTFGIVLGPLYLLDRALRRLSPRSGIYVYDFMAQPVVDKPLLSASLSKNLNFRAIDREDPVLAEMPLSNEVVEARFRQRSVCFAAFHKEALIGYIWFRFGDYEEDEVRCTYDIPKDRSSAFDYDLYVVPERRMGIGFMGVWHGANQFLRERGVHSTFSRMTRDNVASRRSHLRLGAHRVGSACFVRLNRLELMFATVRPFVSCTYSGRPRLRLG